MEWVSWCPLNRLLLNKQCELYCLFQSIGEFGIETSHLICTANHMIGFYMKCNTGLKWIKRMISF